MRTRHFTVIPPANLGMGAIFLVALCGCSATPTPRVGHGTDYLREPETTHYQATAHSRRSEATVGTRSTAAAHPTEDHAASRDPVNNPKAPGSQPDKVQSEIGQTSDIQIDPETRQRMNAGGEAQSAASPKKTKGKKVESEIHDPSDLQIDEQTKQGMDGPK